MSCADHQDEQRDDEDSEDWIRIDKGEWWKVSVRAVAWSYRRDREWTESGLRLPFHPRPPYFQDSDAVEEEDAAEDLQLSQTLPGVQVAEDVVRRYEVDAGIAFPYDPSWDLLRCTERPLFTGVVDETKSTTLRERWKNHVESLLGGILEPLPYDPFDPVNWDQELTGSPSTATDSTRPRTPGSDPDVIDLTDSDLSVESDAITRTSQADKKSYAAVVFNDREPTSSNGSFHEGIVVSPSPSKPLSASALSFVPTFNLDPTPSSPQPDVPCVTATYEFHFPSLNAQSSGRSGARSLPPNLQRDEHGFYSEVPSSSPTVLMSPSSTRSATPKRPSASLLPAFLADASANARTRHTSKTRELVDRLRSSNPAMRRQRRGQESNGQHPSENEERSESPGEQSTSSSSSTEELVTTPDGWITSVEAELSAPERPKDDWVTSLFQSKPAQQRPKPKPSSSASTANHRRAPTSMSTSSTSSIASTAFTPTTPSSASLHSPASSITSFGLPPTPSTAHFPPPPPGPQPYYPYQPSPYGQFVLPPPPLPGAYIIPPWQLQMPMPPAYAPAGYMMPHGPLPPHAPFDARGKVPLMAGTRQS